MLWILDGEKVSGFGLLVSYSLPVDIDGVDNTAVGLLMDTFDATSISCWRRARTFLAEAATPTEVLLLAPPILIMLLLISSRCDQSRYSSLYNYLTTVVQ